MAATSTAAQATEAGKRAYEYGFPLLDFLRIRHEQSSVTCPDGKGNAPINHFANSSKFATPANRGVVAPNTDTLYSVAHLDLKKGPVILKHPGMGNRFFGFQLLEPHTNVIGYIGTRTTGSKAGRYAISWTGQSRNGKRKLRKKLKRGGLSKTVIKSKYRRVWVIGRTLAGDSADRQKAFESMERYRLTRLNGGKFRLPADCYRGKDEPARYPTPTTGPAFIEALNRALLNNPPPKRDQPLLEELATFGIGPGLAPETAGLSSDILAALYAGVEAEAVRLPLAAKVGFLQQSLTNKGWVTADPKIGAFGTDYAYRARIAVVGIGANTPEEAIYPAALSDSEGRLLTGARQYRMVLPADDLPPTRYFWSLTMYDFDGFLIENPIDRYSLGPSHPPLIKREDGSIVIAVQHDAPAEAGVNWLPAPLGGFRLNLRLYGPRKRALNGSWEPPKIVQTG
ncbi:MAG: DUF1254 domain-containing protein [Solirubrobacterales bacterium]